jgi:LPS sulfotransferase NodH
MKVLEAFRPSQAVKNTLSRAALEIRSLTGSSHYRRFVIVGTARTGSTLLINLLNSHSQVLAFGELFRSPTAIGWDVAPFTTYKSAKLIALYRSDPQRFLDKSVFRRWPQGYAAIGFKLFYYHARIAPFNAVWEYLAQNTDIYVLHIKRRNVLEQFVSLKLAHTTDVWSLTEPVMRQPEPLRLEIEDCRKHFELIRSVESDCDVFFARHQVKNIYYEDLTADRDAGIASVEKFLGLKDEKLSTELVRQRTLPLSKAIANYKELKQAFAKTEWADFFHQSVVLSGRPVE